MEMTMDRSSTNKNGVSLVSSASVSSLEVDVVDIDKDEEYLYAACSDNHVRVYSKNTWELVAELGETDSEPLAVDVDDEQIYATCDKRVYVWKKETFGMIGWFELSYQAVTSSLQGDYFFVGAKEGRLVSIQKETHDTSSWQLHKSDISSIWSDTKIICTSTKKEEPRVWLQESNSAPSELARLDKKGKGGIVFGNAEFVFVGTTSGEVAVYNRTDWEMTRTLSTSSTNAISSIWASEYYLIAAESSGNLTLWEIKRGDPLGTISLEDAKISYITVDHDLVYIASSSGLHIFRIMASERPLDLSAEGPLVWKESILKTSPYDVLEDALERERAGDQKFQDGLFHEAVLEYENAMRLLVDNTHTLQEVPTERQQLTDELNDRLGKALLKAKIQEVNALIHDIRQLAEELEVRKRTERLPEDVDRLWASASRIIKESTNLAEAQSDDILSYQLTHVIDVLKEVLENAILQYDKYRETINNALGLTRQISNEWHWMERKRTSLGERKEFLEKEIKRLEKAKEEAESEGEVEQILEEALETYQKIYRQIEKILESYDETIEQTFTNGDEASEAIEGLLKIIPGRREALLQISNQAKFGKDYKALLQVIEQAIETAKSFKLSKDLKALEAEREELEELYQKKNSES